MIEPAQSDAKLLADIAAPAESECELRAWWLGQSGYVVKYRDAATVIDPYLSDSLTTKYANSSKPHVRMHRRVVDPSELGARLTTITAITSSHVHTDHLDPETLQPLLRACRTAHLVICPAAITQAAYERCAASSLAYPPRFKGLDDGQTYDLGQLRVTALASAHDTLERDEAGRSKFLGYVFQFCKVHGPDFPVTPGTRRPADVDWTVYHSGDTVVYDGLADRLRPFDVDVAILPINGKVGNMNGADAARLAHDIGAKLVVPCHYDMFEFNTASPSELFVPECERFGQPYKVLRLGERLTLTK